MRSGGSTSRPSADSKYPGPGGGGSGSRDDLPTLRVTNVSEDVEEDDLRELFQKAIGGEKGGRIARVYIGKDRETGVKKGYAFVSFESREVAQRAMEKVHGKGEFFLGSFFCFSFVGGRSVAGRWDGTSEQGEGTEEEGDATNERTNEEPRN